MTTFAIMRARKKEKQNNARKQRIERSRTRNRKAKKSSVNAYKKFSKSRRGGKKRFSLLG